MSWIEEMSQRNKNLVRPTRNAPAAVWNEWREKTGITFKSGDVGYEYKKQGIEKQMHKNKNRRTTYGQYD